MGNQNIVATGKGAVYEFKVPSSGKYLITASDLNADLGTSFIDEFQEIDFN